MVEYIVKFKKLTKTNKFNFLLYFDLSKIIQKEKNIFTKILITLFFFLIKFLRFFYFNLTKQKQNKIRNQNIASLYSNNLNNENFFFKKNFELIIYGIEDLTKLSFTIKSLNQIKQKITQNNLRFKLNIFYLSKNILSPKIKETLKKNKINQINFSNFTNKDEGYFTFLFSGTTINYKSLFYLFNSLTKFQSKVIIYFNEKIINYKFNKNNFFKKTLFKKYSFSRDFLENFNHIGLNFTVKKEKRIFKHIKKFFVNENPFDFLLSSSINLKNKDYLLINKTLSSIDHKTLEKKTKFNKENLTVVKKYHKQKKIRSLVKYNNQDKHLEIIYKSKKKISIIIPASGKISEGKDLLLNLLDGIFNKTNYNNFEVIIIDHDALNENQIKQIKKYNNIIRIKLNKLNNLKKFNFSKNCNIAAKNSRSNFLLFLNDDIEIIDKFWLDYLIGQFEKDHVGIVGSKLYYPNYKIQHAGVGLYMGYPGHIFHQQRDCKTYDTNSFMVRNYKAVTGASLMIRKKIFEKVNGFDEIQFKTNYSDTDLCLKVYKMGLTIVMDPKSKLIHLTSQSRKDHLNVPNEILFYFKNKWQFLLDDGYLNSNYFTYK